MDEQSIKRIVDEGIKNFLQGDGFTSRKLADTPTDDLMITPRKYVNLNGALANRPSSVLAIMGQRYYATDINIPLVFDKTNNVWRNGIGSVIASN